MTQKGFNDALAAVSDCPVPWGQELGKLVDLDRLMFNSLCIGQVPMGDASTYLFRLHSLSWAIALFWKPKQFRIYAPKGHREFFKPIGAVYAATMDLCEKLHSFIPAGKYSSAEWFRLIVEEQCLEGFSTGNGKTADIAQIQAQNAAMASDICPFQALHTTTLINTAIRLESSQRVNASFKAFLKARKAWATALKSSGWKALSEHEGNLVFAPSRNAKPTKIEDYLFPASVKPSG
jgi:hypothetical protein